MSLLESIILGAIEGLTEFLPISSTGHLILAENFLGIAQTDFVKSFTIAIQLGAILAVVLLYGGELLKNFGNIKKVFLAFLPSAIVGLTLYPLIKGYLLGNSTVTIASLILGGVVLILFERFHYEKESDTEEIKDINYLQALGIGVFQAVAVIPGVSRAGATIIGGLALGLKRRTVVVFSFLLAIPTMLAATAYDLYKNPAFSLAEIDILIVGFITSFIVAVLSVKLLLNFIKNHTFVSFGVYRIIAGVAFWILLI